MKQSGDTLARLINAALALALALAAGIGVVHWSADVQSNAQFLENLPATATAGIIDGPVKLVGKVVAAERVLHAPHSKKPCVYYNADISNEDSRTYDVRSQRFQIDDGTATVWIDPQDQHELFDLETRDKGQTQGRRWGETRLEVGHSVVVVGFASQRAGDWTITFGTEQLPDATIARPGRSLGHSTWMAGTILAALGVCALAFAPVVISLFVPLRLLWAFAAVVLLTCGCLTYSLFQTSRQASLVAHQHLVSKERSARTEVTTALGQDARGWRGNWNTLPKLAADLPAPTRARVMALHGTLAREASAFANMVSGTAARRLLRTLPDAPTVTATASPPPPNSSTLPGLALITLFLLWTGAWLRAVFGKFKLVRLIENLPTSHVAGVAYGPTELATQVHAPAQSTLTSPMTGTPCVSYTYTVERNHGRSDQPDWTTETRTSDHLPLVLADHTGTIGVHLAQNRYPVSMTTAEVAGDRREREWVLEADAKLYVLGYANVDPAHSSRLRIDSTAPDFPFLIEANPETQVHRDQFTGALAALSGIVCLLVLCAAMACSMAGWTGHYSYVAQLAMALAVLGAGFVLFTANDLVFLRSLVRRAAANIDVVRNKRNDLIPNVLAVFQRQSKHESNVLGPITAFRDAFQSKPTAAYGTQVKQLRVLREDYPALRSDKQLRELLNTLTRLENELTLIRRGYNRQVESYNTRQGQFPVVILAKILGLAPAPYFDQLT